MIFQDNTDPYLYNKTRHSYIYMLPIAGQTAGPIGLKFFVKHILKKISTAHAGPFS